jgi:hypothetical protein
VPGPQHYGSPKIFSSLSEPGRARQTLRDTRRDEALNKAGAKRDAVDALLAKISEMGCIVPEVNVRRCNTNDLMYATQLVEDAAESCDPYWSSVLVIRTGHQGCDGT